MACSKRLALLRVVVMAALLVSALMVVEDVYPDRAFCPLEQACAKVHESALGSIRGVPTSVVGLGAFALFFALTFLPVEWARRILKPAGLLAALGGAGFIAYQALVLESYCPLCLVVDAAGILAGLLTVAWPPPPVRLSGRFLSFETTSARLAWTFAALLLIVSPFAWPRTAPDAWVEIPENASLFADDDSTDPAEEEADLPSAASPTGSTPLPRPAPPTHRQRAGDPVLVSASISAPPPARAAGPTPTPRPTLHVVEYLNPYCTHCRATHQRFERVLAGIDADVRIRRVYTWADRSYPVWARACAHAQTVGLEDRLFAELIKAPSSLTPAVYAAAQRAGLDIGGLRAALASPIAPRRLVQDRSIVMKARLQGLPTLDIGRRRLMGEQTEADLRAAVEAALATPTPEPSQRD